MIKILYIITLPDIGGAQVHLRQLISKLPDDITPVVIVGQAGWLTRELKHNKVDVHIVPMLIRKISLPHDIRAIQEITKIIDVVQPDIIHCHSSKAGAIGRVAARITNIPVVFTAHGWAFTEGVSVGKRWMYKYIEKMMAQWTQQIFCVSHYDKQLALKVMPEYAEKIVVIHNGIDDIKVPIRTKIEECLNIVMIARFSPQKDQILLIDAIEELRKEINVNLQLTLVGDGPEYDYVYAYANRKECKNVINFLGARLDIVNILSSNDVFVLTSNWEGFPITILEAMRQGIPVLASDVGGIKEAVIDGETGFLISRGDKEGLKEKLTYFFNNRNLIRRMGVNSRNRYLQLFSSDIMMEKIVAHYQEIYIHPR